MDKELAKQHLFKVLNNLDKHDCGICEKLIEDEYYFFIGNHRICHTCTDLFLEYNVFFNLDETMSPPEFREFCSKVWNDEQGYILSIREHRRSSGEEIIFYPQRYPQPIPIKVFEKMPEKWEYTGGDLFWSDEEERFCILTLVAYVGWYRLLQMLPKESKKELRSLLIEQEMGD